MLKKLKASYLTSGILFVILAYIGGRYRNWGPEAFAFLLLTYLIVIIGIRLDELSCKFSEIQTQLIEIQSKLAEIQAQSTRPQEQRMNP